MTNYEIKIRRIINDLRWLASRHNTMAEYKKRMCINAAEALENLLTERSAQQKAEKNEPLTLDELQQMAGEPIWVENSSEKHAEGFADEWALVSTSPHARVVESTRTIYRLEYYGKTWVAYRRKPKEATL